MSVIVSVYQATSGEALAAESEWALRQGSRRIILWRLTMLDRLLHEMEEVRASGERLLPEGLRRRISVFAAWQDPELAKAVRAAEPGDLDPVQDALFDAQGRVMIELSELSRTPSWQEVEQLFCDAADPEFQEAA